MHPFFKYFDSYRQSKEDFDRNSFFNNSPKTFPLTKKYKLDLSDLTLDNTLKETLQKRVSTFKFKEAKDLDYQIFSKLLFLALGTKENSKHRVYPSAGVKYSVGVYLMIFNVQNLPAGLYYFNQTLNQLEELSLFSSKNLKDIKLEILKDYANVNAVFFFSFIEDRAYPKYGSLSHKFCLIEAGHMAQNLQLVSTGLKLQSLPSLSFDFEYINNLFNIDTTNENFFYSFLIAK